MRYIVIMAASLLAACASDCRTPSNSSPLSAAPSGDLQATLERQLVAGYGGGIVDGDSDDLSAGAAALR
jgi:hypothetical protein